MAPAKVAIIGGTGVYENAYLEDPQEMIVETGFGQALFCRGHYREREIYFLARHGTGHGSPAASGQLPGQYCCHQEAGHQRGDRYCSGRFATTRDAPGQPGGYRPVYRFHEGPPGNFLRGGRRRCDPR